MNVLMVSTFYPPHVGGIECHVETLSNCLAKNGNKVSILTSKLSQDQCFHEKSPKNIDLFRVSAVFPLAWSYPTLASQGFTLNTSHTLKKIVAEQNINVIHVHGHHYYLTWKTIATAKKLKVPTVLTLHGLYALNPGDSLAQAGEEVFNYTIFRYQLKNVSATIGLTPAVTSYAQKYGPQLTKYFTIPNGVNKTVYADNLKNRSLYRRKYGISDDQIVVLFRGRFASIKGVCELAEAAKSVIKKNSNVLFLFVGAGPLRSTLSTILQPIKNNSKILDWSPIDQIHELYIASDIFVLPSRAEAFPLTILEAMAAQLSIICTPVGGIPDILAKYPYKTYLEELSPTCIGSGILNEVNKVQKNTAKHLSEDYMLDFDWATIASRVASVYETVRN